MDTLNRDGLFARVGRSMSLWLSSLLRGRSQRLTRSAQRRRDTLAATYRSGTTENLEDRVLLAAVIGAKLDDQVGGTVQAGDGITYLVTLSNTGDANATSVVLSNPLDPNSSFVAGSTKIGVAAFADTYFVIGNTPRTLNAAGGLLSNDVDIDAGGAFTVSGVVDIGGSAVVSGSLVVNADGSFTYTPATGVTGSDIFRYTVVDSDGLVSTGQVTFSISSMVWFVDNSAPGGGDGSYNNPFNSLAPLNGAGGVGDVDAPGDSIFIYETGINYAGGLQLENDQILFGDGYAVQYFDLVVGNSSVAPILTSSSGNNITLASNNVVRGLNLTSTGGTALSGTNFGSATITNMLVNATNATAINLNNGTGTFGFSSVNANGGTNGIVLNGVNATSFAVTGNGSTATQGGNDTGGVIQNMTGDGVVITNSNNITLQNMTIGNPAATAANSPSAAAGIGDDGIQATTVTNLTLKNVTIAETGTHGINANGVVNFVMDDSHVLNAGNDNEEHGILFRELTGDNFIRRSLFDAYNEAAIDLLNTSGQSDLTIFDTRFQDNKATPGNFGEEAVLIIADGTAQIVALVTGTAGAGTQSIFDDNNREGIQGISQGTTSSLHLTVENSRFLESSSGDGLVIFQVDNTGSGNLTVKDNFFTDDTNGPFAVIANNASTGLMDVTITNNTTVNVQLLSSIHDDIGIAGADGQTRLSLTNNNVTMNNNFVPVQIIVEETPATGSAPDYSAIITGNTNTMPDGNFTFTPGLLITVRNQARFNGQISGNSFQGDPTFAGGPGIQLEEFGAGAVVNLQGFGGGNNIATQAFLDAQNPASTGPSFVNLAAGSDGVVGSGAATAPVATTRPNPLVVAPPVQDPGDIGPVGPAGPGLSQADLDAAVAEAIARWTAAGLSANQIATLQGVDIQAAALGSGLLGVTIGNHIRIDDNGADFGWFIDSTIGDDAEFNGGSSVNGVDLLTVVMHEFGHVLGVSHTASGLMGSSLTLATRYNPTADLVATAGNSTGLVESLSVAVPAPGGGTGTGNINFGTIPLGSTVQARFQATVTNGPGLPNSLSAQGTVTGTGGINVLTDDPNVGGASDPTVTNLQSLTLGGTVWSETGGNTVYNLGSDTAVNGITVRIYQDNGDGVLTVADGAFLASTTTSNMAGQDGRYEFTNLAPGNYIVEVLRSGAIATQNPIAGAVDPDNNVNNDNNGSVVAGFDVASAGITLDYGTEPGGDVNNTLDFGFEAAVSETLTISISLATMSENGGSSSVTVTRSGSTVGDLVVNLSSNDTGEATVPVTVTILNGQASANFNVTAVDDNFIDGTQTVTITATAAGFSDGTDTIDVLDNDVAAIVIVQSGGTTNATEGGANDSYTVALATNNPNQVDVTVTPNAQVDLGAGPGVAIVLTFNPGTGLTPQTVSVAATDDLLVEGNHFGTISHVASSTDPNYNNLGVTIVNVSITDNDAPVVDTTTPANANLLVNGQLIYGAGGTVNNNLSIAFDTGSGHYILTDIIPINAIGGLAGNDLNADPNILEFDPTMVGLFNQFVINLNEGDDTLTVNSFRNGGPEGLDVRNDAGEGDDTIHINGNIGNAGNQVLLRSEHINIGANISTNNQNVRLEGPVTLTGPVVINAGTGSIVAPDTINGPQSLALTGSLVQLDGAVGGNMPLTALTATGSVVKTQNVTVTGGDMIFEADTFTPSGNLSGNGDLRIRRHTAGTRSYTNNTLQFIQPGFANVILGSGLTTTLSILSDGNNDLVTGSVNVHAPLTLVAQSLVIADSIQQGMGPITFVADTNLQFSGLGAAIGTGDVHINKLNPGGLLTVVGNIGSPTAAAPWAAVNLFIDGGTGGVKFTGGVGGAFASIHAMAQELQFTSAGAVVAQGDVSLMAPTIKINGGVFSTTGDINLQGNLELLGNNTFKVAPGKDLIVSGTVTGNNKTIIVRGNGGAADQVHFLGDVTGVNSFQIDSSGVATTNEVVLHGVAANKVTVRGNSVHLNGDISSAVNVQIIGPTDIDGDITVTSGVLSTNFTQFSGTVNSVAGHDLTVHANAGRAIFSDVVGGVNPLGNLTVVSSGNNTISKNITVANNFLWDNTGGRLILSSGRTISAGNNLTVLANPFANSGILVAGGVISTP